MKKSILRKIRKILKEKGFNYKIVSIKDISADNFIGGRVESPGVFWCTAIGQYIHI